MTAGEVSERCDGPEVAEQKIDAVPYEEMQKLTRKILSIADHVENKIVELQTLHQILCGLRAAEVAFVMLEKAAITAPGFAQKVRERVDLNAIFQE